MSTKKSSAPRAPQGKTVDVQPIIDRAKQDVPANLKEPLDKIVLSGMRIMFDRSSHKLLLDELDKPGPLAQKLGEGIIMLMYMLWEKSNKTIPPQLIVPATLVLTLEAFSYVQESKDPEATKDVLGEAVAEAIEGVMDRFGATQDKIPALRRGAQGGQPGAAAQPEPAGLLAAATGDQP